MGLDVVCSCNVSPSLSQDVNTAGKGVLLHDTASCQLSFNKVRPGDVIKMLVWMGHRLLRHKCVKP